MNSSEFSGSGRRGRRPGSTFGPSRLSIDSTGSEHPDGPGTLGTSGASSVRAMSTRPRKPLPDTSFFFPSSYDEASQGAVGPHLKKRYVRSVRSVCVVRECGPWVRLDEPQTTAVSFRFLLTLVNCSLRSTRHKNDAKTHCSGQ